jgi:hypothetical protein
MILLPMTTAPLFFSFLTKVASSSETWYFATVNPKVVMIPLVSIWSWDAMKASFQIPCCSEITIQIICFLQCGVRLCQDRVESRAGFIKGLDPVQVCLSKLYDCKGTSCVSRMDLVNGQFREIDHGIFHCQFEGQNKSCSVQELFIYCFS